MGSAVGGSLILILICGRFDKIVFWVIENIYWGMHLDVSELFWRNFFFIYIQAMIVEVASVKCQLQGIKSLFVRFSRNIFEGYSVLGIALGQRQIYSIWVALRSSNVGFTLSSRVLVDSSTFNALEDLTCVALWNVKFKFQLFA